MIDTHCHLTFPELLKQIDDVLARAPEAGVDRMISVGTTPGDSASALEIARQYGNVYATVGLHPGYAKADVDIAGLQQAMAEMAGDPRVVAFGEMGLDYHYPDPPRPVQTQAFAAQLELIAGLEAADQPPLPIVIHNRKATDDVLAMLRESGIAAERFVFHCFTGSAEELAAILDFGAMVSFTGIVTFKNAADLAGASDAVPMDRLMVETDSPYLTPEPNRKTRPNEPRYVTDVAKFLAQRRQMPLDDFIAQVDANAQRFFARLAD